MAPTPPACKPAAICASETRGEAIILAFFTCSPALQTGGCIVTPCSPKCRRSILAFRITDGRCFCKDSPFNSTNGYNGINIGVQTVCWIRANRGASADCALNNLGRLLVLNWVLGQAVQAAGQVARVHDLDPPT